MDTEEFVQRVAEALAKRSSLSGMGLGDARQLFSDNMQKLDQARQVIQEANDRIQAEAAQRAAEVEAAKARMQEAMAAAPPVTPPPSPPEPTPPEPFPDGPLVMVTSQSAAKICQRYSPSTQAATTLHPGLSSRQFLDRLLEQELHLDAIEFLAHGLSKRVTVIWAGLSIREAMSLDDLSPAQLQAFRGTFQWVVSPTEETRRAVESAAAAAGASHPAGLIAWAAFASEGSLAPPQMPAVLVPPNMTAQLVKSTIRLASLGRPTSSDELLRRFLVMGIAWAASTPHAHHTHQTDELRLGDVHIRTFHLLEELGLLSPQLSREDKRLELWRHL